MPAEDPRRTPSHPGGPQLRAASSLAPSVRPVSSASRSGGLGTAEIGLDDDPDLATRPAATSPWMSGAPTGQDLPTVPSAVIEALDPRSPEPRGDSAPYPTLEAHPEELFADPLEPTTPMPAGFSDPGLDDEIAADTTAAEGALTSSPPPLPEDSRSHLRLVAGAKKSASAVSARRPSRLDSARPTASRAVPRTRSTTGRAFGTNPPRARTPLPVQDPSLYAELDEWTPPLRREESVIAEAAALRNHGWHRFKGAMSQGARHASRHGVRLASSIGETSLHALRRFERLPRRTQVIWVAAPYLGALILVVLLVTLRSEDPELAPVAPEITRAVAPDSSPSPTPDPAEADAPSPAEPTPPPTADVAAETAPAIEGHAVVLPRSSTLFKRPNARDGHSAKLRAGAELMVFTGFPAPEGWHLAQSTKGTIGFVSALHLEGKSDPRVDRKRKRRRRARRR